MFKFWSRTCFENNTLGLINCAISKKLLSKSNIGVTEFSAKKSKFINNSEVMMIRNNKFSVCPITTHIDIKDITTSHQNSKIWQMKLFKKILKDYLKERS